MYHVVFDIATSIDQGYPIYISRYRVNIAWYGCRMYPLSSPNLGVHMYIGIVFWRFQRLLGGAVSLKVVPSRGTVLGDAQRGSLVALQVLDPEAGVATTKAPLDYLVEQLRSLELSRERVKTGHHRLRTAVEVEGIHIPTVGSVFFSSVKLFFFFMHTYLQ